MAIFEFPIILKFCNVIKRRVTENLPLGCHDHHNIHVHCQDELQMYHWLDFHRFLVPKKFAYHRDQLEIFVAGDCSWLSFEVSSFCKMMLDHRREGLYYHRKTMGAYWLVDHNRIELVDEFGAELVHDKLKQVWINLWLNNVVWVLASNVSHCLQIERDMTKSAKLNKRLYKKYKKLTASWFSLSSFCWWCLLLRKILSFRRDFMVRIWMMKIPRKTTLKKKE